MYSPRRELFTVSRQGWIYLCVAQSPLIQGQWELLYTSKSAFDIKNPLGRRVDGSTPGLEAAIPALTSLFGDAAAKVRTRVAQGPLHAGL